MKIDETVLLLFVVLEREKEKRSKTLIEHGFK